MASAKNLRLAFASKQWVHPLFNKQIQVSESGRVTGSCRAPQFQPEHETVWDSPKLGAYQGPDYSLLSVKGERLEEG